MREVLRSQALAQGLFFLQDTASQLCVAALDPQPGETVIDLCAAPGGKSLLAGQLMEDRGRLLAFDLHPHRVELIRQNAARCGLACLTARTADGTVFIPELAERADRVLCDVPCSGMGVIRKKPDVRYKDGDEIKALPPIQRAILDNAARYVRPGGKLVYSTCTLLREENEKVAEDFLAGHPEFSLTPFSLPIAGETGGLATLWPHIHGSDGFFIAKFTKAGD